MTLRDLLRSSFRCIAVLHEGQGPNSDDITDALTVMNSMLEAWSVDRLNIFCIVSNTYTLIPNQQTYAIGPGGYINTSGTAVTWVSGLNFTSALVGSYLNIGGFDYTVASVTSGTALVLQSSAGVRTNVPYTSPGFGPDFNAPRPIRIDRASVVYQPSGQYAPELPLYMMSVRQWEDLAIKTITSTIPTQIYADNAFPNCNLNLWPIPTLALPFILYTWQAVTTGFTVSQLDAALVFPPGYQDAIRYNLAVRLAPEWDKPLRDDVAKLATESKMNIQSLNAPSPVMTCDPAMLGSRGVGVYWSYLTGQFESR